MASRKAAVRKAAARKAAAHETAGPDVAAVREQLRAEARARLGVTGSASTVGLGEAMRRHGLAYYPLVALSVLYVVDQFQGYAFTVLAPDISRALGLSIAAIAGAVVVKTLAVAVAPMPVAALSQRPGRRALLCLVTAMVWSLMTIFTGFVTALAGLVVVLAVDGLSTGSVTALHIPLLMDTYHPEARVRVISAYTSAGFAGNVGSPLLVALLAGAMGLTWRGVFLAMGLLSTALTLVALRLRDPGYGRWDTQQVRAAVHGGERQALGAPAGNGVELGFWEICRRLMMVPTLRRMFVGFAVYGLLVVPLQTFLSYFLDQRWNMGAGARGLFFAYYAAASVVGLVVYGRRGERQFQQDPARVPRTVGVALGLAVCFIALGGLAPSFGLMLALFGMGGAFVGPLTVGVYVAALSIVPAGMRPHAQALGSLFVAAGAAIGVLFFNGVQTRYGIDGSVVAVAFPGLLAAAIIATAGRHIDADLDRMIDDVLEEEEINRLRAAGVALPLLACRGIDFRYGQLQVLFGVDFIVDEGEMVALLGVNGAGKSTLLRVISGIGLPKSGSVRLEGQDITFLDAERRVALGITQVPGGRAVFGSMNVVDNLRSYGYSLGRSRPALETAIEGCFDAFPRLAERRHSLASTLSGGEQQMLGLSKALILRPRLLLIDELSLGLAPVVVGPLLDMVRTINAEGAAVVLVEQSVNIALSLVDHAYFMEKGEIRFDGRAADLLQRDDLLRAVFLEGAAAAPTGRARRPRASVGQPASRSSR